MNKNLQNRRPNDFPELQVGYPERNDVRDPNNDRERLHVNLDNFELKRLSAEGVAREMRGQGSVGR